MSDEEYGRAWARMMGKRPWHRGQSWYWYTCTNEYERPTAQIPPETNGHFGSPYFGEQEFASASEAYAALGKAVQAVQAAVPLLADELR